MRSPDAAWTRSPRSCDNVPVTGAADTPSSWDALVAAVTTEAAAQHARFDAAVFHAVMGLSGAQLAAAIAGSDGAPALLRSYARLVAEAIGAGLLDHARVDAQTGGDGPRDLLAWGLVRAAPTLLPKCDPARRPHHLAALWNLGEGILREPPWLNTYASTFVPAVTDLDALPAYLTALLDPVVRARPTARWKGPFTAAVADPRALLDAFLPGALHLAAPSVVCLHDRRDATHLALLFAAGTPARLFGPVPCLGHGHRDASAPPASVAPNALTVDGAAIALEHLRDPHTFVVSSGGFAVVTAVDSQRLWIVESP